MNITLTPEELKKLLEIQAKQTQMETIIFLNSNLATIKEKYMNFPEKAKHLDSLLIMCNAYQSFKNPKIINPIEHLKNG